MPTNLTRNNSIKCNTCKRPVHLKCADIKNSFYCKHCERDSEFQEKRLKIIQSLSEIVSVNGRPFNYLLDSGLLNLLKPDLERLDNAGHGINLNKNLTEIKDYVKHVASEIRKSISTEVEN